MLAGRYEITCQLGGGGFAITYLARDHLQPSKPLCVVKQLRPNHTHPRVVEFFEKEAAILERLGKHPQIPQLLAHFCENQNLYIVQEFIEGQDLSQEIVLGKRLSEGYVTKLLQDVLEVLSFVHQQGVIHRDIKPQNLMRRHQDGKIFLIDFGAVKEIGSLMVNAQGEITSSFVIGTAGYMPNEQKNGKPCLGSDVYALGMTAIQALTGILPSSLEEHPGTGEVIWVQEAQVSNYLTSVLTKMVRRHYKYRYLSAVEALQELISPPQSLSGSSQSTQWSRRKVIQTVGFVGVGLTAAVVGQRSTNTGNLTLKSFPFEVVTVDAKGKITKRRPGKANFFAEDLGNGISLEMVEIPSGKFLMGSPTTELGRASDEGPQHTVTIQSFFIGKYAVTQQQWETVMGNNPSYFKGARRPVEQVSWNDAVEFCKRLSQKIGKTYSLPTEAQWEYACRAGTTTPFHFGETITTNLANYDGNYTYANAVKGEYREQTTDVGKFLPNGFGLYDMHGNIWEWCQDAWHDSYKNAPVDGTAWMGDNENQTRLLRGGSWIKDPRNCRSAYRGRFSRDFRSHILWCARGCPGAEDFIILYTLLFYSFHFYLFSRCARSNFFGFFGDG
ncbi:bifunctional serine/threonine-protein kinase/formylglycine-generating enzyme family protein [Scytonema hofmannii]|uniref:bifunctional serine/threonine-protein kinase/formylglycine-generating enzyme family protein n=1 Tax=Scytonema hofmannii TaxID=34078 RepID=UPI000348C602|nr:bifunctional serine/threonine-protein kinase/formylglycine-generating enzyme family protein [Scytonema hofmannii]